MRRYWIVLVTNATFSFCVSKFLIGSLTRPIPDDVAVPYGFSIKVVLFANVIGSLAHTALPRTSKGCLTAYRRTWD